jgi:hypothetical protein
MDVVQLRTDLPRNERFGARGSIPSSAASPLRRATEDGLNRYSLERGVSATSTQLADNPTFGEVQRHGLESHDFSGWEPNENDGAWDLF